MKNTTSGFAALWILTAMAPISSYAVDGDAFTHLILSPTVNESIHMKGGAASDPDGFCPLTTPYCQGTCPDGDPCEVLRETQAAAEESKTLVINEDGKAYKWENPGSAVGHYWCLTWSATVQELIQLVGHNLTNYSQPDYVDAYVTYKAVPPSGPAHYGEAPLALGGYSEVNIDDFQLEWPNQCDPPNNRQVYYEVEQIKVHVLSPKQPEKGTDETGVGEPIGVIGGDVYQTDSDLSISCPGLPLKFARSYHSVTPVMNGSLGPGWNHSFQWRIHSTNSVFKGTNVEWRSIQVADGKEYTFRYLTNGSYAAPPGKNYSLSQATGTYTFADGSGLTFTLDTNGSFQSASDAFGNSITATYTNLYPSNLLVRLDHSCGSYLAFSYSNGSLTRVVTPNTNLAVLYSYDSIGMLTSVVRQLSATNLVTSYWYATNQLGLITQKMNAAGTLLAWSYATNDTSELARKGIETRFVESNYFQVRLSYDTNLHRTTATYARNGSNIPYTVRYDAYRSLVTEIRGPVESNFYGSPYLAIRYDAAGNATSLVAVQTCPSESDVLFARYDDYHHPTNFASSYNADLSTSFWNETNTWSLTWLTNFDRVTSITDPEGHGVQFNYLGDRLTNLVLTASTSESFNAYWYYSTNGLLASNVNENGHGISYTYDGYGRLDRVIPQAGPAVDVDFDTLGHVHRISLPGVASNRTWNFTGDELGRVTAIQFPDGRSESRGYDGMGRMVSRIDSASRTSRFAFMVDGSLASVSRWLNTDGTNQLVTTSLSYDQQMNLIGVVDPLGRAVETYTLDNRDRPVIVVNNETQQMKIGYGIGTFVKYVSRFDGTVVSNLWNRQGWLATNMMPGLTNRYTYYRNGILKTASNKHGAVTFTIDALNRVTGSSMPMSNGSVAYARYPAGNVSNVVSVAGTNIYAYDAAERLQGIESPVGSFSYTFNSNNGLAAGLSYPGGMQCAYGYDVMDRVTNIAWTGPSGQVLRTLAYAFDAAGLATSVVFDTGEQRAYAYDSLGRLVGEASRNHAGSTTWAVAYAYDLAGNRTTKTLDGMTVAYGYGGGDKLTNWSVSATGSLWGRVDAFGTLSETIGTNDHLGQRTVNGVEPEQDGTNFWRYDVLLAGGSQQVAAIVSDMAGNTAGMTNSVTVSVITNASYAYDAAGNLISFVYAGYRTTALAWDGAYRLTNVTVNGTNVEDTTYDALGRRLCTRTSSSTNYYLYDGLHVIADLQANGTVARSYTYGPGIDNILAMTVHGASTSTYLYIKDRLGSVLALATTNGSLVEQYRYDAWGRVSVYDGSGNPRTNSAVGNRYLFQGREYSWNTGLYFFRARWYDPITGRWLSKDPIGISGGLNQYAFVRNNPINFIDPWGLLVFGTYDVASGILTITDEDTGETQVINAESGGKPYGDPIPTGEYEIFQHPNPDFFRLDPLDASPRDDIDSVTGRNFFRLHRPGRTIGCIAAKDKTEWEKLRDFIKATKTLTRTVESQRVIPHTGFIIGSENEDLTLYGELRVINTGAGN